MSGYDFRDACEAGDLDKVKGLLKSVDINETDEYGYTGLHLAAEHGHIKVVEELMAASVKLDPLVFDSYYLPVHLAINKGHTDIAKKLINAGCKINELIYVRDFRSFYKYFVICYFSDGSLLRSNTFIYYEGEHGNI